MLIKHNLIGIKLISLFISAPICIPSSHNKVKACVGRPIWFRPLKLTFSNNNRGPEQ